MTDYSLRELECFLAVAEELSFTRAAERLRLAQPPLSRHIRNLEEKLGVQLFERSKRRVALTPGGRAFRGNARDILLQVRQAGEAARRAAMGETDRLEVGFVSAVLSPELVEVFTRFRKRHPQVQLHLHDRLPSVQIDGLKKGELDLGFVGLEPNQLPAGLAATPWMEEELLAFLPPDHALRAGETAVRLKDLSGDPFVMVSSEAAPAFAAHVGRICEDAGFRPRVVQEARRAQAVAAMTVAGSGVAILPASLNQVTGNGLPLRRAKGGKLRITHCVAHQAQPTQPAEWFLETMRGEG